MGKFEIFVGADGQFYFHLKAENGLIIAASQGYTTKQSAENGIEAIKRVASQAEVLDLGSTTGTASES
ncbi:MAG: YegP family protein [Candidatus Melainabacteria bacterium]|nr:YegP family protein [Candidatus Melainabacteria bacterium]